MYMYVCVHAYCTCECECVCGAHMQHGYLMYDLEVGSPGPKNQFPQQEMTGVAKTHNEIIITVFIRVKSSFITQYGI